MGQHEKAEKEKRDRDGQKEDGGANRATVEWDADKKCEKRREGQRQRDRLTHSLTLFSLIQSDLSVFSFSRFSLLQSLHLLFYFPPPSLSLSALILSYLSILILPLSVSLFTYALILGYLCTLSLSISLSFSLSLSHPISFFLSPPPSLSFLQSIDIYLVKRYYQFFWGGARGVMVIVVGNGHGDTSSNPGRDWLHFT